VVSISGSDKETLVKTLQVDAAIALAGGDPSILLSELAGKVREQIEVVPTVELSNEQLFGGLFAAKTI
jgi:hypothetical protein